MSSMPFVRRFAILGALTILTVYTLILIGGIVRASGAGMGCPDWPTCFGRWIPPTHESQLPQNYQQVYADRGYQETRFNARKTWTEYLNRLAGVTTGFLILLTVVFSVPFLKRDPPVFYLALAALLLVAYQGWLGAQVVASNLHPGMITLHMLLAQIIVALLVYAISRSQQSALAQQAVQHHGGLLPAMLISGMLLMFMQMVLGTQVREAVDVIAVAMDYLGREQWVEQLPPLFTWHRVVAVLVVFVNLGVVWQLLPATSTTSLTRWMAWVLLVLTLLTAGLGVIMHKLDIPVFAQPLHLWLASMILGCQLFLFLTVRYADQTSKSVVNKAS